MPPRRPPAPPATSRPGGTFTRIAEAPWHHPDRPTRWRCTVPGCHLAGRWQFTPAGVMHVPGRHYADTHATRRTA